MIMNKKNKNKLTAIATMTIRSTTAAMTEIKIRYYQQKL